MRVIQVLWGCIGRGVGITLIVFLFVAPSIAQISSVPSFAHPRITQPVSDAEGVLLPNSIPRIAQNALDKGRMDPSTRLEHLVLVLKVSSEQDQSVHTL